MQGLNDVVSIAAGYYHSLALKKDGTIWAWGNNEYGQLGDGTLNYKKLPIPSHIKLDQTITPAPKEGR